MGDNPAAQTAKNTAAIAGHTGRMADAIDWRMQGLGVSGADALAPTGRDIARWGRGSRPVQVNLQGGTWFQQAMADFVADMIGQYERQRSSYAPAR